LKNIAISVPSMNEIKRIGALPLHKMVVTVYKHTYVRDSIPVGTRFSALTEIEAGSSAGIVIECGLDGLGSKPGGDEIFCPSRPSPGANPASCTMGTESFPGVQCGRGVLLTTHPPSSAAVMEEYSYTYTHPLGHTGPVTGSLYIYFTKTCKMGVHRDLDEN
jgi:hypothetical protein